MALTSGQWQTAEHTAFIARWVAVYEPFRMGNNMPLYWETMYDAYFEEFSREIDLTMLVSEISRLVVRRRRVGFLPLRFYFLPNLAGAQRLYNAVMREVFLARERARRRARG
ncbi:hypothetical protein R3P38DRAFT_2809526 [Favolaschia claudopus]|uniref:Uncharacterized protein n=1 Tax=Favolaschia claudopus TaxID=2862362 RepID=A0AAV9ZDZ6_9AGAR